MIESRTRVPDAQTTLALLKMTGFEWIATHVAERTTRVRPQVNGFVRIQSCDVHPAVGDKPCPLPAPWSSGRDDIGVTVRPRRRHPTLRRSRVRRHVHPEPDMRASASSPGQFPTMNRNASDHRIGERHYQEETNGPTGSRVPSRQTPVHSKASLRIPDTDCRLHPSASRSGQPRRCRESNPSGRNATRHRF